MISKLKKRWQILQDEIQSKMNLNQKLNPKNIKDLKDSNEFFQIFQKYTSDMETLAGIKYYVEQPSESLENKYRIRRCPVPLCLVPPPVSLGKSWSLTISLKKNYIENFRIRNYFKKDFLNFSFHYVRYYNHLVTFLEKNSHQFSFFKLSMKLARAISSSSSVKSDHLSQ